MSIDVTPRPFDVLNQCTRYITVSDLPEAALADVSASILLEVTLPFTATNIWKAMTEPENLARWFSEVSGDFHPGGMYYVANSSWGRVLEVVKEQRFSASWNFDDRISKLNVDLTPPFDESLAGKATLISIAHSSDLKMPDWEDYGVLAVGSAWDAIAYKLAKFLSEPGNPQLTSELQAWEQSEEARRFTAESIERWTEATIEYGVDKATALAMRDRTLEIMSPAEA